jgi:hypothetical protein
MVEASVRLSGGGVNLEWAKTNQGIFECQNQAFETGMANG